MVASGAVGEPLAVRVSHAVGLPERLRGWRINDPVGGGVVQDLFVHDIADVGAILGGQASSVISKARTIASVPDSVASIVTWDSGVVVQTHDAFDNFHLPTYVEILGTEGALRAPSSMTGDPVGEVVLFRRREATQIDLGPLEDLYLVGVRSFERAVRAGTSPLVTGYDGIRAVAAAAAATDSLRMGCEVHVEGVTA